MVLRSSHFVDLAGSSKVVRDPDRLGSVRPIHIGQARNAIANAREEGAKAGQLEGRVACARVSVDEEQERIEFIGLVSKIQICI